MVISDPELAGQILDRSRTPHQIDKPHEPMFYHIVDEVMRLTAQQLLSEENLTCYVPATEWSCEG